MTQTTTTRRSYQIKGKDSAAHDQCRANDQQSPSYSAAWTSTTMSTSPSTGSSRMSAACGCKVVPELRFASFTTPRVVETRLAIGDRFRRRKRVPKREKTIHVFSPKNHIVGGDDLQKINS